MNKMERFRLKQKIIDSGEFTALEKMFLLALIDKHESKERTDENA